MVSELAREDILNLELSQSIRLTPDEIIQLNALGLKVENGQTNDLYTLPRVAILKDIVLREPTIGHEVWIDEAFRILDATDNSTTIAVRAYACSVEDPDELPSKKADIIAALFSFRRKVRKYTPRQIIQALDYVVDGSCAEDGECPYYQPSNQADRDYSQMSIGLGVMLEGQVVDIGCSLSECRKLTRSQIELMTHEKLVLEGKLSEEGQKKTKLSQYFATLEHIKQEHLKNG